MGGAVCISFLRNILFGYSLDPSDMGYYSIVITVSSYGALLQLGLMNGLNRELPVALGQGKKERNLNLVGETTSSVILIQTFFLIVYFIVISLISFDDSIKESAFFLAGLAVIPSQLLSMVMLRLRAEQRTMAFAILHLLTTITTVAVSFVAIQYFGFKGAIWVLITINLLAFIIVTIRYLPAANYLYFNSKDISYLLRIGFPTMLSSLVVALFLSMDKLFIMRFLSIEDLGLYQIAFLPMVLGVSIQSLVSQFLSPKLLFKFGAGSSLHSLYKESLKVSVSIMLLMVFLGPLITFIIESIIEVWLPRYSEALPLITIFYVASIFMAANLSDIIYSASNKPLIMLCQNSVLILIACSLFLFISLKPIIWYAYAVLILQLLKLSSSLIINFLIVKNMEYK
jgi:O-antigen/teichoic acid export membrane protein